MRRESLLCEYVLTSTTDDMTTLYHATHETALPAIQTGVIDGGLFDGIFAAGESAAASHAPNVFAIEIDDELIATGADLRYADADTIREVLRAETGIDDADTLDELHDAICDDNAESAQAWEGRIPTREIEPYAGIAWELQRLRGRLAAALGFVAVEMDDEHGTSYLVVDNP